MRSSAKIRRLLLSAAIIASLTLIPADGSESDTPDENPATAPDDTSAARFLQDLKFRSVVSLPGGELFSLSDTHNDRSFWIAPGEVRHGIEVLGYDPDRRVLKLRYEGAERDIPLSRPRIGVVESPEEANREGVLERWQERREERRAFRQRWEEALQEFPELREIEDHVREIIEEMRGLREALAETQEGSTAYGEILDRQQDLAREHRLVEDYLRATVSGHPAFEPEDVETLLLLQQLVRHAWPELEVAE